MDRTRRREERERRRYHLIAAADIERAQCQEQRIRSAGATDRELRFGDLGDLMLQLFDSRSENEELGVDDLHHRGNNFVADLGVLCTQIQERYGHFS